MYKIANERKEARPPMKLSVIIPIYNVQDYLAACLDSVIAPGSTDYEIIAVNDGSTDGSPAVLADYAERFPGLVKTVATPNGGLGHARNVGISLARGEYLLFLDSDDTLSPGAIREILGALDGSFDIGVFDFVSVDKQGRVLRYSKGCGKEGGFTLSAYPAFLLSPPNAVNKLWRRALFIDSGISFPDRKWFEDLATIPRLYLRSGTIRTLPHPWYRYLQRDGSITRNTDAARNLEMLDAIETVMTDYERSGAFGKYHRELEAMAAYHELLTSSTRVNLIDPKSPVQDALVSDYLARFPGWRDNPYIRAWPKKHRLLLSLILRRRRRLLHALLKLNEARKKTV